MSENRTVQPDPPAEETWKDWPLCPRCGQRRHAVCPACQLARDDLLLADYIPVPAPLEQTRPPHASCGGGCCGGHGSGHEPHEPAASESEPGSAGEEEPAPILLVCPQCDEVFAPRFYRQCRQCEHDFGSGLPAPPPETVESNARPLFVLVALVAVGVAILAYCWRLFQR